MITNMVMKIIENFIFKVKTKRNVFNKFVNFMPININQKKKDFLQKL